MGSGEVYGYLKRRWGGKQEFLEQARYGLQELPSLRQLYGEEKIIPFRPQLDTLVAFAAASRNLRWTRGTDYRRFVLDAPLVEIVQKTLDAPMRSDAGVQLAVDARAWADLKQTHRLPAKDRFVHAQFNPPAAGDAYLQMMLAQLPRPVENGIKHDLRELPLRYVAGPGGEPVSRGGELVGYTTHEPALLGLPSGKRRPKALAELHLKMLASMLRSYEPA